MVEVGSKRTNYEFTADEHDADGQKKPRPDGDKLRLLVLGRYAGSLIGKGGENFQRLREKYNVKITGLSSRANERVVQLDGPRSDCLGIVSELLPLCPIGRYPSGSGKNTFEVNILANTDAVGMLIGKGGTKIKEIKEQTNTKINVYPECLPNSNERVVALGGENEEVVVKGMEFVLGILDSAPRRSATVFFRPDQLEGKQLSIPDISGKGMGATNTTNTLPTVSNNNNNNNNKGSSPQLPNNNQSDIQNIAALLVAQRNTKQQNGFDATFDFGSAETVTTLTLNNDICGAIIGQGGQNIRYIKEVSGAQVDMTKSDGGSDRTLTMRGNQDQIQIAEQLMAQCVRASKRGGQQQSPPQQQQQQEQQQQMQQQPWDQPQQHHHQPWQQQQQQQQQQGHWQQQQHMHNPATMQLQQQMHQPPAQQHHQPWNQPW